ncbi:MAG: ATP synthase F0 subunit C [Pseudomonadales bacterium]|jgi:F-type H+-transporting ATPase subunit c|nr:ATP synthase F0 subunit C [Pseudomonadales bacterium]
METEAVRFIAAALVMGMGTIFPSMAQGNIAKQAMESIGRNPESGDKISSLLFVSMAICESASIYALVVSLIILFA